MKHEMHTLPQLVKEHNALVELILESGGELNPTLEEWLKVDETSIAAKVDSYKFAMDDLESRVEFLKSRVEVYRKAAGSIESVISRIKETLKFQMQAMNTDEVRGNEFRFKLSKPSPRLAIINAEDVPPSFTDEEIIFKPNKDRIKLALDSGESVPGAKIELSQSLRSYPITSTKKAKPQIEAGE